MSDRKHQLLLRNDDLFALHEAKKIIDRDIRYHMKIPELAVKVGLNENKLKRGFKEVFEKGIYEYLVGKRMEKAMEYLETTDLSTKEIAQLLGYKHLSTFTAAFSRFFDAPPTTFRRVG